jgi:hypothetical protein
MINDMDSFSPNHRLELTARLTKFLCARNAA